MKYKKPVKRVFDKDTVKIGYVTDTHIGPLCNMNKLRNHIDIILEECDAWFHGGDVCDCISPKDRRFDLRHPTKGISWEYHKAFELFEPIADKGLVLLHGNHDITVAKTGWDEVTRLGKLLDIETRGVWTMLNLKFPNHKKDVFLHHGAGGGRKKGAKAIRLKEWAEFVDADLYLMGHNHNHMTFPDRRVLRNGKHLTMQFCSGMGYLESWMDTDNYVEMVGLPPTSTGFIIIEISKESIKFEPIL